MEKEVTDLVDRKVELEKIEILAKLQIEGAERIKVAEDMEKILAYVEKIAELDTDGVEPLVHINPAENVYREDVVTNIDGSEDALQNAPQVKEGQFVVPKTV